MGVNEVIVVVMALFLVAGAVDRALGHRLGLGEQFEQGINTFGPLALSMVGMISLAPALARLLSPVVVPCYTFLGADPAMFAGTLLANDMGGFHLAQQLGRSGDAALLAGTILAAMLGCTVVFTIPVGLGIITKEHRPDFAHGVLVGLITIPVGVLVGGLVAGFTPAMVLRNLLPIVAAAGLIGLGLWRFPRTMTRSFLVFGKVLVAIISMGLAVASFEFLTGWRLMPRGWELTPVDEGLRIVALLCLFLMGAFPLMHVLTRVLRTPLARLGRVLGMNEIASGALIIAMANAIPAFMLMEKMGRRGVFLTTAWSISAMSVLGNHFGFTASVAPSMMTPMIVGKLTAALTALTLAHLIARRRYPDDLATCVPVGEGDGPASGPEPGPGRPGHTPEQA